MMQIPADEGNPENNNTDNQQENTEQQETTRTITFTVTDGTDPVSGATVAIGQKTGTTGSAGGCSLTEISDGENTVTVTCDGYNEYSGTITVSENDTTFTIELTASSG